MELEHQIKLIMDRVYLLGDVDRVKYYNFYGYVNILCTQIDDIDAACSTKLFILDHLEYDNNRLFNGVKDHIYNLDLISTKKYNSYFMHDDRLAKYVYS